MEERPLDDPQPPPLSLPDLSPEARRQRALRWQEFSPDLAASSKRHPVGAVVLRVASGAWHDGFIHAGNLAYMSILALFPFFVLVGAALSLIGEQAQRAASVHTALRALPPVVANALEPVAQGVIVARSGWLLWAGALIGLWTFGSLLETIRDVLRRAYGTGPTRAYWRYRLISTVATLLAVAALFFTLIAQVAIGTTIEVIAVRHPWADKLLTSQLLSAAVIYVSLFGLFFTLTPTAYRARPYPKWPGALLVTVWWMAVSIALPPLLHRFFTYDLTYGSLAGVMIALFFFWLVGLGMVMGAELNAALAESPEERDMLRRR